MWLSRPIKAVLLDISGVLRDGNVAIPGSIEAFKWLKSSGISVRLVTNESQVPRVESLNKLLNLGYKGIELDDISAPIPVLVDKLRAEGYRPHLLVHPKVINEFDTLPKPSAANPANCVVIGDSAEHFTYDNMNTAFRTLLSMKERGEPVKLFTLGKGRYYNEDGLLWLDVGPFTAALEYALDIEAELVGKPAASFFHGALKSIGVAPEDTVMIGDDIKGDVQGAQDAGLRGVLVRTGKFRSDDESHPTIKPDAIVDNLSQAVELMLSKHTTIQQIKQ